MVHLAVYVRTFEAWQRVTFVPRRCTQLHAIACSRLMASRRSVLETGEQVQELSTDGSQLQQVQDSLYLDHKKQRVQAYDTFGTTACPLKSGRPQHCQSPTLYQQPASVGVQLADAVYACPPASYHTATCAQSSLPAVSDSSVMLQYLVAVDPASRELDADALHELLQPGGYVCSYVPDHTYRVVASPKAASQLSKQAGTFSLAFGTACLVLILWQTNNAMHRLHAHDDTRCRAVPPGGNAIAYSLQTLRILQESCTCMQSPSGAAAYMQ